MSVVDARHVCTGMLLLLLCLRHQLLPDCFVVAGDNCVEGFLLEVDFADAVEEAVHTLREVVDHSGVVCDTVSVRQLIKNNIRLSLLFHHVTSLHAASNRAVSVLRVRVYTSTFACYNYEALLHIVVNEAKTFVRLSLVLILINY